MIKHTVLKVKNGWLILSKETIPTEQAEVLLRALEDITGEQWLLLSEVQLREGEEPPKKRTT